MEVFENHSEDSDKKSNIKRKFHIFSIFVWNYTQAHKL